MTAIDEKKEVNKLSFVTDPPMVSVLMPVYNAGRYLAEAVDSILLQEYSNLELIAIDDGSTDGSNGVLLAYQKRDSRVCVLANPRNMGIVATLNLGLSVCRGKYVARMDADDIALPDRLQKQVALMESDPATILLGSSLLYIDEAGESLGVVRHSRLLVSPLSGNTILHPTVIFRRESVVSNKLAYREKYRYAEDYYLWLELSRMGTFRILDEVVVKYRVSRNASRFRHLRRMLGSTMRAELDAILYLGLRPSLIDICRFLIDGFLWCLPEWMVTRIYLYLMFGRKVKLD